MVARVVVGDGIEALSVGVALAEPSLRVADAPVVQPDGDAAGRQPMVEEDPPFDAVLEGFRLGGGVGQRRLGGLVKDAGTEQSIPRLELEQGVARADAERLLIELAPRDAEAQLGEADVEVLNVAPAGVQGEGGEWGQA